MASKPSTAGTHQVGNFRARVERQRAQVRCYGIALHRRVKISVATKSSVSAGTYDTDLPAQARQWRIALLRCNFKFIDGRLEFEKVPRA